jgi:type I restriction enzyme S subunit
LRVPSACSQSVAAILPSDEAIPEIIHFALVNRYDETRRLTGDNERTGLNLKLIRKIVIPLPPQAEQKNIAARLNEQMAAVAQARRAAEEQVVLLTNLINSYFRASLETPTTRRQLSECLVEIKKGVGRTWQEYPVIGATRAGVAPAKEKVGKQPERYKLVEPGTILYNPMRINIGSIAMLDDGDKPGITSPDYVVFKSKKGIIHPRWFYYWFRSPYGENFIKTLARGAVRERMLFTRLGKGEVDLPSWEIQCQVAEKLKEIKALKQALENQLAVINRLPSVLLRRAFGGL